MVAAHLDGADATALERAIRRTTGIPAITTKRATTQPSPKARPGTAARRAGNHVETAPD